MASKSLLPSKYFDKLAVNRLQAAGGVLSDNVQSLTPSYLYSLVFEGTFERNNEGGILTIEKNKFESGIAFTDRPFRQSDDTLTLEEFTSLFTNTTGTDTFEEDPPNGVLVHGEEQKTYEITLNEETNQYSKFNLKLLPGENHNLNTVTGRMSFFVDDNANSPNSLTKFIVNDIVWVNNFYLLVGKLQITKFYKYSNTISYQENIAYKIKLNDKFINLNLKTSDNKNTEVLSVAYDNKGYTVILSMEMIYSSTYTTYSYSISEITYTYLPNNLETNNKPEFNQSFLYNFTSNISTLSKIIYENNTFIAFGGNTIVIGKLVSGRWSYSHKDYTIFTAIKEIIWTGRSWLLLDYPNALMSNVYSSNDLDSNDWNNLGWSKTTTISYSITINSNQHIARGYWDENYDAVISYYNPNLNFPLRSADMTSGFDIVPGSGNSTILKIIYFKNKWVAYTYSGYTNNRYGPNLITYSLNGKNWKISSSFETQKPTPSYGSSSAELKIENDTLILLDKGNNTIYYSSDGINWTN